MKYTTDDLVHNWRTDLYHVIFEADTKPGRTFDIILLFVILLSVFIAIIDSVPSIPDYFHDIFYVIEWIITILFTVEYILRIIVVKRPRVYILSFFGIIDLLAFLPSYLGLFFGGTQYMIVIRALRLLRTFRIFKLVRFLSASRFLIFSLQRSFYKIAVFFGFVLILVTVFGAFMYMIEGPESGFVSIPASIYWAIVTLTTVGYGDITPVTVFGQALASFIMILGYSIIAIPTGIVAAEIARQKVNKNTHICSFCGKNEHEDDAGFCKNCGNEL